MIFHRDQQVSHPPCCRETHYLRALHLHQAASRPLFEPMTNSHGKHRCAKPLPERAWPSAAPTLPPRAGSLHTTHLRRCLGPPPLGTGFRPRRDPTWQRGGRDARRGAEGGGHEAASLDDGRPDNKNRYKLVGQRHVPAPSGVHRRLHHHRRLSLAAGEQHRPVQCQGHRFYKTPPGLHMCVWSTKGTATLVSK